MPPASMPSVRSNRLAIMSPLAVFLAAPVAVTASQPSVPFVIEETGAIHQSLQDAVDAIADGEGTIIVNGGTYRQCAVQTAGAITYRAAKPGAAVFDGTACEGKAALVLRGRAAAVEGLVFANISVPDRNGAGIRLENGTLAVSRSWFRDSEQGILTAAGQGIALRIDRSTFSRLGTCEGAGGCAHSVYAGDIRDLTVIASRFEEGRGGHYLKSRAARNEVRDSSFDDSGGRATNYMIDLPNGGTGAITGNMFVQGADKENYSAYIALGAEGASYSMDGLRIADNDAGPVPGLQRRSVFVADWTGDALDLGENRLGAGLEPFERR